MDRVIVDLLSAAVATGRQSTPHDSGMHLTPSHRAPGRSGASPPHSGTAESAPFAAERLPS